MTWPNRTLTAQPRRMTTHSVMLWILPLAGTGVALAGLALTRVHSGSHAPLDHTIAQALSWVLLSWNILVLASHIVATLVLFALRHRPSLPTWARFLPRSSILATGLLLAAPAAGWAAPTTDASEGNGSISVAWPVENHASQSGLPRAETKEEPPSAEEVQRTQTTARGFIPTQLAAAPLPRELGHPKHQRSVVVRHGDTLWDLASRHLGAGAPAIDVAAEVQRWHAHNKNVIGEDPNIIYPGQELAIPS